MAPGAQDVRASLDIQLFGRFLASVDGRVVDDTRWGRRSARTLVKLLALTPAHTLHREQIIEALWPGLAVRTAANNLDKAIHGARRALEPELAKGAHSRFILTPRNQVILTAPGALCVDADRFEQAANQALRVQDAMAAREALGLYVGALLVDELFEEWTLLRRESLRQLFRSTTLGAAERFAQTGDHASGIELLRRLVHEDAADEQVHLLLMRLYAGSGRRDQALMQFEQGRRSLLAAGLELGPEITRLRQALSDERARPVSTTDSAAAAWSPHVVPITFRSGIIRSARMAPDGCSVLLTANWEQGGLGLYRLVPDAGPAERLPLGPVEVFAVSPQGHLVIGLEARLWNGFNPVCILALQAASGGAPMPVLAGVQCADLQPGAGSPSLASMATALAVVREVDGRNRLEFPIGRVLFETGGWISQPRFSADGRHIAFLEHPIPMDDEGHVVVIDVEAGQGARPHTLSRGFITLQGLAWRQKEVWFTASRKGANRSLYSVDLADVERARYHGLGNRRLHDSTAAGRLLISAERGSFGSFSRHASDVAERDITWHERTIPRDISNDGQTVLVEEAGTGGRHHYAAYLRAIDGSATRMIADGVVPLVLSPDQRRVILRVPVQPSRLAVLDLASGSQTPLENDDTSPLVHTEFVSFFPDGNSLVFSATDRQGGLRIYTQALAGGKPVCMASVEPGMRLYGNRSVAPDGRHVMLVDADDRLYLHALAVGRGALLAGLPPGFYVAAWADDGDSVFVHRRDEIPARVYRYRLSDGHMDEWLSLSPRHVSDARRIPFVRLSPDGRSYAYGVKREASDLYLFEEA